MPRRRLPPAVHLPGYTIVVEPNGVLVYTYTRAVGLEEASPAAACNRRLPRPPPAELDSDQGSTASDDSEESMTPPDHDKGEPYLVEGRPMLTCRIEPHRRRRVMQVLAEGVHNEYTRRVRKYKRYLRRMRREAEAEAEQDLGAAFASLGLAPAEGNAHFNSSDLGAGLYSTREVELRHYILGRPAHKRAGHEKGPGGRVRKKKLGGSGEGVGKEEKDEEKENQRGVALGQQHLTLRRCPQQMGFGGGKQDAHGD